MNREEIFDKVRVIIVDQLGIEEDDVELEASLIDDLGADELDIVEIVMALEEEFGVSIPEEIAGPMEAPMLKTVSDLVDAVIELD